MQTKNLVIGLSAIGIVVMMYGVYDSYRSYSERALTEQRTAGETPRFSDLDATTPVDGAGTDRIADPSGAPVSPGEGKIKADVFIGTLEEVNTGCFADGECYVVVDGKHVTAIIGWSRDVVGSVIGVPGFGDLTAYLGKSVEVYAHMKEDGSYSLYGSEGFHIKVLDAPTLDSGTSGNTGSGVSGSGSVPGGIRPPIVEESPIHVAGVGCAIGGCSGEICTEASVDGGSASTCIYRPEYTCYRTATCERQEDGQCGWTRSLALLQCLQNVPDEVTVSTISDPVPTQTE